MKQLFWITLFSLNALNLKGELLSNNKLVTGPSIRLKPSCVEKKCPTTEDPLCVKLKYITPENTNKSIYIVMLNKCELEYVNCFIGVEALVMPLKNCGHDTILQKFGITKARRKRDASESERDASESEPDAPESQLDTPKSERDAPESERDAPESERDAPESERDAPQTELDVSANEEDSVNSDEDKNDSIDGGPTSKEFNDKFKERVPYAGEKYQHVYDDENELIEDRNSDMDIKHSDEKKSKDYEDEVDRAQFDADCPTVCPMSDMMVCAKCKHGVYRSFPSICHIRMFNCKHPVEDLELITHYPCVLSAPYLKDSGVAQGRMSKPYDEDIILKFIQCRYKHPKGLNSLSHDPNCDFREQITLKKTLEEKF